MTKELPEWLNKTAQAISEQERVRAEKEKAEALARQTKEAQDELLKSQTISKLEHQINTSLQWWNKLQISSLLNDVSKFIYPGSSVSGGLLIKVSGLEGDLSFSVSKSVFNIFGWAGWTHGVKLSSPNLAEALSACIRPGTNHEHSNLEHITQSIYTEWTTYSGGGEGCDPEPFDHHLDYLTIKMQGDNIYISPDGKDTNEGIIDKKYIQILKILPSSTPSDLQLGLDNFLSGNIHQS